MIPHPLDLRTIRPGETIATTPGAKSLPEICGDAAIPSLNDLLARPPSEALSPDLPQEAIVVDAIAYRIVKHLYRPANAQSQSKKPLLDQQTHAQQAIALAMAWFDNASTETRQRLIISFAQHYEQLQITSNYSFLSSPRVRVTKKEEIIADLATQVRDRLLGSPDALAVLPTVDRLEKISIYLGPEQVGGLRAMGWRDAAGRDIDSCLLSGALAYHDRFSLPIADQPPGFAQRFSACFCPHDEAAGTRIEQVFKAPSYTLKGLLTKKGLILTPTHREWLRELQSQPTLFPDPYLLVVRAPSKKGFDVEEIQGLLDLDRTNRLMQQASPAPHQGPVTTPEVEPPQITL